MSDLSTTTAPVEPDVADDYSSSFALGAVALAFVVLALFVVVLWTVRGL